MEERIKALEDAVQQQAERIQSIERQIYLFIQFVDQTQVNFAAIGASLIQIVEALEELQKPKLEVIRR